jgi:hypothetical protein
MITLSRFHTLPVPTLPIVLLMFNLLLQESRSEDLSEILRQISEEKSGKTSEKKNTSAAAEPTPKKKAEPQKSQVAKPQAQAIQTPVATTPRWIVYGPKDKLPKNLQGCAVAGDFKMIGEDVFGGALLVAADSSLFFARRFIVKNSSSGYAPGTILPAEQHRIIRVPRERPLLFQGRDMLPGEYLVHAQ